MPKPRLPALKAAITGATAKNPGRFKGRANPKGKTVGAPPEHLSPTAKRAWRMFASRMPWLTASDEAMLELASMIRGQILAREDVGVQKLGLYATTLSKLGATPTDRTKVTMPDDDEEEEDKFFGPH
jgi:phage terminase small subunit